MNTKINEYTDVVVESEYINEDILIAKLEQLEASYIETISWLFGFKDIIEKNDKDNEEEAKNIEDLNKEKEKIEKNIISLKNKIDFLKQFITE